MPKVKRHRVLLSTADLYELRQRVETPGSIEAEAWAYHKKTRCDQYLDDVPNPVQRTGSGDYPELDADSRKARNLAVGYVCTGDDKYAFKVRDYLEAWAHDVTPAVGDEQCAYHQAYGAWSFALAFDLVRHALPQADVDCAETWFLGWSFAYRAMMDEWAEDFFFSTKADAETRRYLYKWTDPKGLTYNVRDWYTGRDATLAPMAAWLAAATVCGDRSSVDDIFNTHRLNVPTILHAACAPDNDGDALGTNPAPTCQIFVSSCDYLTYHARLASMLLQQADMWARDNMTEWDELDRTWSYLRQFAPPAKTPNGQTFTTSLYWPRMQMAKRLFGIEMVTTPSLYESQFLGPVALTQFAP